MAWAYIVYVGLIKIPSVDRGMRSALDTEYDIYCITAIPSEANRHS